MAKFGGAKAEVARVDNALMALEQYLRNSVGETEAGDAQFSFVNKNGIIFKEGKYSTTRDIAAYKEKEYNKRGWVYVNNVLTYEQSADFLTNLSALKNKHISNAIKHINDKYVAVPAKGNIVITDKNFDDYTIHSVLKGIDISSDEAEIIAEVIGNGENKFSFDLIEVYIDEGLFDIVYKRDFPDYSTLKREGKNSTPDSGNVEKRNVRAGNPAENQIETDTVDTPKGVSSSFDTDSDGNVTNKNGDLVAVDNNGSTQFNIRTFEDGGREYLERYLAKQSDLTAEDKADILSSIDFIYDMVT